MAISHSHSDIIGVIFFKDQKILQRKYKPSTSLPEMKYLNIGKRL
jgi:hypothetical protein